MLRVLWIFIGLWLSAGPAWAQAEASALARPVRPVPTDASLAQVLAELSRQSGVPFSYSSTRIGAGRRCRLRGGPARPLGTVLHELTRPHRLSYGLLNGQLVLWPATEAPPAGIEELNGLGQLKGGAALTALPAVAGPGRAAGPGAAPGKEARLSAAPTRGSSAALPKPAANGALTGAVPNAAAPALVAGRPVGGGSKRGEPLPPKGSSKHPVARPGSLAEAEAAVLSSSGKKAASPAGSGARAGAGPAGRPAAVSESASRQSAARAALLVSPLSLRRVSGFGVPASAGQLPLTLTLPAAPEPLMPRRPALRRQQVQLSLVSPLGTNWLAGPRTVNDYSLNVLGGYAAGVRRVELAGIVNVVRDTVRGLQAAGIVNVTGNDVRGVQLAGFVNINGGAVRGVQGAGVVNVVRDDVRGLQVAGLVNISGGAGQARKRPGQPPRLRRWLGLARVLATDPLGQLPAAPSTSQPGLLVQAAAVANITGTDVRGLQTATFFNMARRVKGVQLGLVNVARHVSGTQIGLINLADSVDGASIGVINIVRHGYLHGEVWASESLPLNATLKLGVRRYYTLLGVASEPFGNRVQWASGFGVGTAGRPRGRVTLSLDLIHWTLAGTSEDVAGESIDSRMLTQLRPALAWQLERQGHLQLVLSPTLNLATAWSKDSQPQWEFGANQWLWIDAADEQSRIRLWPGLQVGLRF